MYVSNCGGKSFEQASALPIAHAQTPKFFYPLLRTYVLMLVWCYHNLRPDVITLEETSFEKLTKEIPEIENEDPDEVYDFVRDSLERAIYLFPYQKQIE